MSFSVSGLERILGRLMKTSLIYNRGNCGSFIHVFIHPETSSAVLTGQAGNHSLTHFKPKSSTISVRNKQAHHKRPGQAVFERFKPMDRKQEKHFILIAFTDFVGINTYWFHVESADSRSLSFFLSPPL